MFILVIASLIILLIYEKDIKRRQLLKELLLTNFNLESKDFSFWFWTLPYHKIFKHFIINYSLKGYNSLVERSISTTNIKFYKDNLNDLLDDLKETREHNRFLRLTDIYYKSYLIKYISIYYDTLFINTQYEYNWLVSAFDNNDNFNFSFKISTGFDIIEITHVDNNITLKSQKENFSRVYTLDFEEDSARDRVSGLYVSFIITDSYSPKFNKFNSYKTEKNYSKYLKSINELLTYYSLDYSGNNFNYLFDVKDLGDNIKIIYPDE